MTEIEKLRASFHGATYFDLDNDRFDPMGDAFIIAAWVGELKRTRQTRFTVGLANCFISFRESLGFTIVPEIDTALFHSLGKNVWETLLDIAEELQQSGDAQLEYDVHYRWIGDDATMLWQQIRENRSLTITGPLLDFPIADVSFWNAQADRLVEARRFGI